MKKFFVIALALIFVAPFVADMAIAGDLSVSGTMRVRAWTQTETDFDDAADSELKFWDQRLRTAITFTGAEGISAHLRTDFSEITWGSADWAGSRPETVDNELQVDRAYLQVVRENYTLKAGQLYAGLGNTIAFDDNQTGILVDIKNVMPITLTLGLLKLDEGNTNDEVIEDDKDVFLANVAYAADAFSLNVFTAMEQDQADDPDEATLFGAQVKTTVAGVALNAEVDTFSGSNDATNVDYIGTQMYVNAEKKFSDQLTAGLDFVYAQGTDDAGETQLTHLNGVFGDWCIMDRGPFNADIVLYDEHNPAAAGVSGASGGSMGGGVYADYAAMEGLLLQASVLHLTIPEDSWGVDSVMTFNLGLTYDLAPNTTLAAQYNSVSVDADVDVDTATTMVARLQIKF